MDKIIKEDCCGCEACADACPVRAIRMEEDNEGFRYPSIDMTKCISCNKCISVCPIVQKKEVHRNICEAYACYNTDEKIREESTSGGLFTLIAEYLILRRNAVVYGVAFDEGFNAKYIRVEDIENLGRLRGSKYIQANATGVYSAAKKDLLNGRVVFFTGLPCQTEALRSFLGQSNNNLILMDMVCFGIGSPGLWRNHIAKNHPNLGEMRFKDKTYGWKNWGIKYVSEIGEILMSRNEDEYMSLYLNKINIRPSCFNCKFKGIDRNTDFTVADCWGVGEKSQLNDDKGLSALLLHSKVAIDIFDKIKHKIKYESYMPETLMMGNWATCSSVNPNPSRDDFFKTQQF